MTGAEGGGWRGSAFGLELYSSFRAPGIASEQTSRPPPDGATRIALAAARAGNDAEPLFRQPLPVGDFSISRDDAGYLADHGYFGRFRVSADGRRVECAPGDLPEWLWQRFLVGQLLPLASLLRGLEPLHASAVVVDGRALLLMGASGTGKSSVALHLVARGAAFLADDVAALELRDGAVVAHPGARLTSVDRHELERLPAATGASWARLGVHEDEVRIVVEPSAAEAVPVGGVLVLTRPTSPGELSIEPVAGWPELLLGGTFNAYLRAPERLLRQLDVAARLAETVPLRQVTAPEGTGAGAVAEAILASR